MYIIHIMNSRIIKFSHDFYANKLTSAVRFPLAFRIFESSSNFAEFERKLYESFDFLLNSREFICWSCLSCRSITEIKMTITPQKTVVSCTNTEKG